MSNDLTAVTRAQPTNLAQFGELSVQGVVDRKRKILEVMSSVMAEGVHYGKIPGCGDKPALFKAGAEILATTFGLAPKFKITRTDHSDGHREYEIVCTLTHVATGLDLGEGVGGCSSRESKYRWRRGERKCPQCSVSGAIMRSKFEGEGWYCFDKKGGCGAKFPVGTKSIEDQNTNRMENPDIADQYNTVLKMAKKRAQVDCTLTVVGASDMLTQDLEDLPPSSSDIAEFTDAEFVDRPASKTDPAPRTQKAPPSNDPFADIEAAKTPADLEQLVPFFTRIKDPQLRSDVRQAYSQRKALLQSKGAA